MKYFATDEERETYLRWLEKLEDGHVIVVRLAYPTSDDRILLAKVTGLTATQIRVFCKAIGGADHKFRRKDGRCIGNADMTIEPMTEEIRATWRENALNTRIVQFINDVAHGRIRLRDLPMHKRLALLAAIEMSDLPQKPEQQALPGVENEGK